MWVVVPVKQFNVAKRRLATVLSGDERTYLAKMMLHDVLQSLTNAPEVTHTAIIARDAAAEEVAHAFGCQYLVDKHSDLSRAVQQGAEHVLKNRGLSFTMVPGDVPLVSPAEISSLINAHTASRGITIVTDRHGDGTNGLVVSPPDLMPFQFGVGSCEKHCQSATSVGAEVKKIIVPGLSLDIDTPSDLVRLLEHDRDTASSGYLKSIDAWNRLNSGQASREQTVKVG